MKGLKKIEVHPLACESLWVRSISTTLVDHHLLRSSDWRLSLEKTYKAAQNSGHKMVTAAELVGVKNNPLECFRQKLYEDDESSFKRIHEMDKTSKRGEEGD
jgi:predicted metallo-beta-lactamase superfamily hydrolase